MKKEVVKLKLDNLKAKLLKYDLYIIIFLIASFLLFIISLTILLLTHFNIINEVVIKDSNDPSNGFIINNETIFNIFYILLFISLFIFFIFILIYLFNLKIKFYLYKVIYKVHFIYFKSELYEFLNKINKIIEIKKKNINKLNLIKKELDLINDNYLLLIKKRNEEIKYIEKIIDKRKEEYNEKYLNKNIKSSFNGSYVFIIIFNIFSIIFNLVTLFLFYPIFFIIKERYIVNHTTIDNKSLIFRVKLKIYIHFTFYIIF